MKQLLEVGSFLRSLRARMRFGELSRAPLRLLRLQLQAEADGSYIPVYKVLPSPARKGKEEYEAEN